jgi:glycerol-3-phosphate dehydrogenase
MHVCQDLEVPVIECGSIAPILYPDQLATAKNLTERAFQNGVFDYEILPAQDILEMEPVLNPEILGGIYSPRDRQANQFIFVSANNDYFGSSLYKYFCNAQTQSAASSCYDSSLSINSKCIHI